MKAVTHSWWIGAIISTILTFAYLGTDSSINVGMLLFMGIVNGIFWGWIIGLIIDKIGCAFTNKNVSTVSTGDLVNQKVSSNSSNVGRNHTSVSAEYALELSRIIRGEKTIKQSQHKGVLRMDGYYISEKNSLNSFIILFTSKGYVAMQEMEEGDILNYSNDDLVQIISEGEALTNFKISDRLTKYDKNGDDVSMKFFDPEDYSNIDPLLKIPYQEPMTYSKWSGKIISDGLLLNLEKKEFSYALKDYEERKLISKLKFKFVPIVMN